MEGEVEQEVRERKKAGKNLLDKFICPIVVNMLRIEETKNNPKFNLLTKDARRILRNYCSIEEIFHPLNLHYSYRARTYYPTSRSLTGFGMSLGEHKGGLIYFSVNYRNEEVFQSVGFDEKDIKRYLPGEWEKSLPKILETSENKCRRLITDWNKKQDDYSKILNKERDRMIRNDLIAQEERLKENFGL